MSIPEVDYKSHHLPPVSEDFVLGRLTDLSNDDFSVSQIRDFRNVAEKYFKFFKTIPDVIFGIGKDIILCRKLLLDPKKNIAVIYLSDDQDTFVGQGAEKTVHYGIDAFNGQKFAVARLEKEKDVETTLKIDVTNEEVQLSITAKTILKTKPSLLEEIEVMSLTSPLERVVHLHSFIPSSAHDYMILEPFSYFNLHDCIFEDYEELPALTYYDKGVITARSLLALKDLHDTDIVHQDIKPSAIFLEFDSDSQTTQIAKVAIGDFGLSVAMANARRRVFCGTYRYLSPERCIAAKLNGEGHQNLDKDLQEKALNLWVESGKASDVWALGVTLFELTSKDKNNHFIRNGLTKEKTLEAIRGLSQPLVDFRIDEEIEMEEIRPVLKGMLQVDPDQRWTINEVLDYLSKL